MTAATSGPMPYGMPPDMIPNDPEKPRSGAQEMIDATDAPLDDLD